MKLFAICITNNATAYGGAQPQTPTYYTPITGY
jgi:hypothetical protein